MSGDHVGFIMDPMPPMEFEQIGPELRYHIERALDGAGRVMEGVGRGIGRTLRDLDLDTSFDLDHDFDVEFDNGVRIYRVTPGPAAPRAPRAPRATPAPTPARTATLTSF